MRMLALWVIDCLAVAISLGDEWPPFRLSIVAMRSIPPAVEKAMREKHRAQGLCQWGEGPPIHVLNVHVSIQSHRTGY